MHYLDAFQSNASARSLNWMPKHALNVNNCEVARFFKVHAKGLVEPISFTVPRKVCSVFAAINFLIFLLQPFQPAHRNLIITVCVHSAFSSYWRVPFSKDILMNLVGNFHTFHKDLDTSLSLSL